MSAARRRNTLLILAAGVVLGAPAPSTAVAAARIQTGATSAGDPVVLHVAPDGRTVQRLRFQFVTECEEGPGLGSPVTLGRLTVGRDGRFTEEWTRTTPIEDEGLTATVELPVAGIAGERTSSGDIVVGVDVRDEAGALRTTCSARTSFRARRDPGTRYGGATSNTHPVVLRLKRDGRAVRLLHIGYSMPCEPEGAVFVSRDMYDFPIRDGRFGDRWVRDYTGPEGQTETDRWFLRGRIQPNGTITGTVRVRITYTDALDEVYAECDTGPLTFRAVTG